MNVVRVKPGVEFTVIAPGGFRMLAALVVVARNIKHDVTITSACDGVHSGPEDPHKRGEAYDIRTHDAPYPRLLLQMIQTELGDLFYAFVEDPDTDNEHIHMQVRHYITYP